MMLIAHRWLACLARFRVSAYYSDVPDKDGNGFSSLNTQSALTAPCGFFSCVCLRVPSMSGGGGEALGLAGFLWCASLPTLPFAAHPVWKRGAV